MKAFVVVVGEFKVIITAMTAGTARYANYKGAKEGSMQRWRVTHLVDAQGNGHQRPVVVEAESSALAKMVAANEIDGAWTDDTEVEPLPQLRANREAKWQS